MQEILLKTVASESRIRIENGCVRELGALLSTQKNFLLTDSNVYSLYAQTLNEYFKEDEIFVLPAGEEYKNFSVLEQILEKMARVGLNRNSLLFAVGGGVVGDMGGLASALYMRGIAYTQIPTTLLAQIDSSVGGKTAVDFGGFKNLVGAFYQPKEVLIDTAFLETLPDRERKSGWGELVKYGGLNEGILRKIEEYLSGKTQDLLPLITACVAYKVGVVTRDEKEQGERKSLNLGHTTAHALELNFSLSHGESVLYGLALETLLAIRLGVCERRYGERFLAVIKEVLKSEPYQKLDLSSVEDWAKNAKMDKKNTQGFIVLTLVKGANEWTTQAFDFERYVAEMKKSVYELWGEER